MIKTLLKIFAVSASAISLIILMFFTEGTDALLNLLATMDYIWIAVAFLCMFLYWVMDSLILRTLAYLVIGANPRINFFKVTMTGCFFGNITPYASGSQPAQVYSLIKNAIKPGHSVSILIVRSAIYQTVLSAYSLIMALTSRHFFADRVPYLYIIYFVGFSINVLAVILYITSLARKDLIHKLIELVFKLLSKIKISKNTAYLKDRLEKEVDSFAGSAEIFVNNKRLILKCIVFEIAHFTFYLLITFFIYISIEDTHINLWYIMASQTMIIVGAQMVPLPGAAGGTEGLGYVLYSLLFNREVIIPVILIWRIITYYSGIVLGGLVYFFSSRERVET